MSAFNTVPRARLYESIVDQVLESVRNGAYAPGSMLPPERVLADQFGVGRGSVREALRILEHANVLEVRVGSGTFVTAEAPSRAAIMRAEAAVVGDYSPLDVVAARTTIEPRCAALAAVTRNQSDLEELRRHHARVEDHITRGDDPTQPDLDFHLAVAAASHNGVLHALVQQLTELMRRGVWTEYTERTRQHGHAAEDSVVEHLRVLKAITAHDEEAAATAMTEHLSSIEQRILDAYSHG